MSAPETKLRSPAPVTIKARDSGSATNARAASSISDKVSRLSAFMTPGRFTVSRVTAPLFSTSRLRYVGEAVVVMWGSGLRGSRRRGRRGREFGEKPGSSSDSVERRSIGSPPERIKNEPGVRTGRPGRITARG